MRTSAARGSNTHQGQLRRTARSAPDAVALLKADHRQVATWFDQFEHTRSAERKQSLASKICNALKVHTEIEE
ncbi:MAG TPA: hypothetical protein VII41_03620, partial [Steroidobacteraceae bacterium]